MQKDWYNPNTYVKVMTAAELRPEDTWRPKFRRHTAKATLGHCLLYPLSDGPSVALLVFMPPVLFLLSLPLFDWIALVDPFRRANWALGLLALPIFLPLLISFTMTLGYTLLVLGQLLVSSAMGEVDQPRWPEWNPQSITEGLGRWIWAGIVGVGIGWFPITLYWLHCGDVDWFDWFVIADLVIVCAGYSQMALAAALLHDDILGANPVTVFVAIVKIGWDYLFPSIVAGVAILLASQALWSVLFRIESLRFAALALWGFWVFVLYEAIVVFRMLGLTYYSHAVHLVWFRRRPKWATPMRPGRIYTNS